LTLITGKNNAGKTATLEAIFVHSGHRNPNLVMVVNALRGLSKFKIDLAPHGDSPWLSTFYNYDDSKPILLQGVIADGSPSTKSDKHELILSTVHSPSELSGLSSSVRSIPVSPDGLSSRFLKLEYLSGRRSKPVKNFLYYDDGKPIVVPPPPIVSFQTRLVLARHGLNSEETAIQFASLQVEGKTALLVEALQEIEPRLKSVELVFAGEPALHGDIGLTTRRMIPLAVMGDGVTRVAVLILAAASSRGGCVLVDDIETGLHHSVLDAFWRSLIKASEIFNVQIIATTHSEECVAALTRVAKQTNHSEDVALVRLERTRVGVQAVSYSESEIESALQMGLEVR
jgi:hypothetical protein